MRISIAASASSRLVRIFFLLQFLLFGDRAAAQDSVAASAATAASSASPSAALRDLLAAACAQNQNDFAHFLTLRNKQTFTQMAPGSRVAFMKRFVLLNEPGKPSLSANPAGRPIVLCQTPAGAAEIQIGGADVQDNVAFMPVDLRDATDSTGASAIQVNMGLVREGGEWKILSLGLVLLDLPSLELEWDSADADKNEESAVESLKTIAEAVETFRRKYTRLPASLSNLGAPFQGPANADSAGLLDSDLAAGIKNGYSFRYVILGASNLGAPARFALSATPLRYGHTGRRSFFRDAEGILRAADRKGGVGNETDPKLIQSQP